MNPLRLSVAAAAIALTAACSSTASPTASVGTVNTPSGTPAATTTATPAPARTTAPARDPQTYEGAKAAVDRLTAAYADKDGGTAWDLLTTTGQAAMTRANYAKVLKTCPHLFTDEITLSVALNDAATVATVTSSAPAAQGGGTFTWSMVYENGFWRHQPSDGAMAWMSLSPAKAISALRSSGAC